MSSATQRVWTNWAGDEACSPAHLVRPTSCEEVATAVEHARERGGTIRVAGAGHSFNDAVLTEGVLLSLERMNRVVELDRAAGLVRVEAGMTLKALSEELDQHGLALPNLGDIDVQSVAGAASTGTHGTGARLQNLSAGIHSLELVLADGTRVEINEDDDADAWRAARVSVGSLGVITALTLRTVPAFTLHGVDSQQPLAEVLEALDEHADSNEHFEFYNFPHSDIAITRTNNRTDHPPRPRSRAKGWFDDIMIENHLLGLVCRAGRRWPRHIPSLNQLASRLAGSSERFDRSHRIFSTERRVRFTEMEYALPRNHARVAVTAVREVMQRSEFSVPFPMQVRFVAADDALLSPAHGRGTCYIAVHMFEGMEWEHYFRAVEEALAGFDGRPHWGKRHFRTAASLAPLYPEWDRFAEVRRRLDPGGLFSNAYIRRVLGPPSELR
jgi:L-gulono-1,4-lactone dehydrogenase